MTQTNQRYNLEMLYQQVLAISLDWEQAVLREDAEPDEWVELLEQREQIMQQITEAIQGGAVPREEWRQQYIAPALEVNNRLIPIMEEQKNRLSDKIQQLQQGKTVNKQYMGYNTAAYGAFFDTKK